jgi:hypothetical protein
MKNPFKRHQPLHPLHVSETELRTLHVGIHPFHRAHEERKTTEHPSYIPDAKNGSLQRD